MWRNKQFIGFSLILALFTSSIFSCHVKEESVDRQTIPTHSITTDSSETVPLDLSAIFNFAKNCDTIRSSPNFPPPFDTLVFNKVIAYEFDGREERGPTVCDLEKGSYNETINRQVRLSGTEAHTLTSILTRDSTYGGVIAACFEPKLGFIFYQDRSPKAVIDICLDCNFLRSTIRFPETTYQMVTYENGTQQPKIGFSEQGLTAIVSFCAQLNLTYGNFKH